MSPSSLALSDGAHPRFIARLISQFEREHRRPDAEMSLAENLALPLARAGGEELSRRLKNFPDLRVSRAARLALEKSLLTRLASSACLVVACEWRMFLNTPLLFQDGGKTDEGQTLSEIFFARGIEHETRSVLRKYPELRRLWSVQLQFWLRFVERFLRDAARFPQLLAQTPRKICDIKLDLSDPHRGNCGVMKVSIGSAKWIYKPRSGIPERGWFALLSWINQQGFPLPFRQVKIFCERYYHWMETVSPRPCVNQRETNTLCFRAGALLYLVHVLRGVDFHVGNVITEGDQPVFIDCEALFHPETRMPPDVAKKERSLFRTGILPIRQEREFGRTSDESWPETCVFPSRRLVGDPAGLPYHVSSGFLAMHDFLNEGAARKEAFRCLVSSLRRGRFRRVLRPTAHYYSILEQSLSASLLKSTRARQKFLLQCCRAAFVTSRDSVCEAIALQNGDLPVFYGKACLAGRLLSQEELQTALEAIATALT